MQNDGVGAKVVSIDYQVADNVIDSLHSYLNKNVINSEERKQIERLKLHSSECNIYKIAIELILKYQKCIDHSKKFGDCISDEKMKIVKIDPDLNYIRVRQVPEGYQYWSFEIDQTAYKALQLMANMMQCQGRRQALKPNTQALQSNRPNHLPTVFAKSKAQELAEQKVVDEKEQSNVPQNLISENAHILHKECVIF